MALQPWYKVVTPREDLRENRPLDASEFAVHLDQVRDGRGPDVYRDPQRFFERTYLTKSLASLATEVARRLNSIRVETSAVFNLSTQFGGGKTHSLTLLYHLARGGAAVNAWPGVARILGAAGVAAVPEAAIAVFVGTEFDSLRGRGGNDGTPLRTTPWGELAWQLAGADGLDVVAAHEAEKTAPGGDVIHAMLPKNRPVLILLDELMNYMSRTRKSGLGGQFYSFLHNLSEVSRNRENVVLAVSVPASEMEMSAEDQADHERLKKLLDRLGKPIIMSAETETSEIIRRRLFEWDGLPKDAEKTAIEFADWTVDHKGHLPGWFPFDTARNVFAATYPFHPSVLSVFERKWRGLPRFQQTRGVLRLLALWVSKAYDVGYKGAHRDPLITLGTAPLDDPTFRTAVFEQLGETRLETAVTTDIVGKDHAHSIRLDAEATEAVKKARLHRKVATAVFFESNGGQQRGTASQPEVRLAVGEPALDIGNVEQCLEALVGACYYLAAEKTHYRFSFQANLNKLLSDRRASIPAKAVEERVRQEVMKVFQAGPTLDRSFFPETSGHVADTAALRLVILGPERRASDPTTRSFVAQVTAEHGSSARTYKSALLWSVAEEDTTLREEARSLLAWKDIESESAELRLDERQQRQLAESIKKAERDLREAVWRAYRNVFLLKEGNTLQQKDFGLVHSSAAATMVDLILTNLRNDDIISDGVSASFLVRNWPPALPEWSTRAVRDMFFASPKFPRLLKPDAVRRSIAKGVSDRQLAYVGKKGDGTYEPFRYGTPTSELEVELAEDVFVITAEAAEAYLARPRCPSCGALEPGWRASDQVCTSCGYHPPECPKCSARPPAWKADGSPCASCGYDPRAIAACPTCGATAPTWTPATGHCATCHARVDVCPTCGAKPPTWDPATKRCRVCEAADVCPKCGAKPPVWDLATKHCTACAAPPTVPGFTWSGDIPPQKWMNFYMKVLAPFATTDGMRLTVSTKVAPTGGVAKQKLDEIRVALRELGLMESVAPIDDTEAPSGR